MKRVLLLLGICSGLVLAQQPVDLRNSARICSEKNNSARMDGIRHLVCDERLRNVAISLAGMPKPASTSAVCSPKAGAPVSDGLG